MKNRTLLAATAAAAIFAANSPAAEQPAKKPKPAQKPAATAKKEAEPKADPAPPAPSGGKPEEKPFVVKDPVATVDGLEIKAVEIEKVLEGLLAQQGGSIKDVPEEMKPGLYRRVIDGMIAEKLVTRECAKIEVTEADVTAELDRFKKRFPDEKTFKDQLASQGQTVELVKKDIYRFLQQNRWMEEKVKGKTTVTEEEAQAFYKENPEEFKVPEQVRASHILVKVDENAKEDVIKAKQQEASKILDRVKKGEDFGKLASELSEDPTVKDNNGDLNFFARERMLPEFSEAAFKMKKGELSPEPVRSKFGFHIIKVTDRKEAGGESFDEAKARLIPALENQKKQAEIGKVLRGLRDSAKVTINLPEAPAPAGPVPGAPKGQ
jgi:peptidyl-prolyl cis-trans isomerase C